MKTKELGLTISDNILYKLESVHNVQPREIEQCFLSREGVSLVDDREEHRTDPPTKWFLAYTNDNRLLKVVYVWKKDECYIKSAFEPNDKEIEIWKQKTGAK